MVLFCATRLSICSCLNLKSHGHTPWLRYHICEFFISFTSYCLVL
uniref:Uncharacterized protein n=1 Tax=Arundo donax TaxID=35708 RepID=A0A0A9G750_ARUDO